MKYYYNTKIKILIGIVIFVFLLGLAGYFMYGKQKTTMMPQKEEATPSVKLELLSEEEKKDVLKNLSSQGSEKELMPKEQKETLKNLSSPESKSTGLTDEEKKKILESLQPK